MASGWAWLAVAVIVVIVVIVLVIAFVPHHQPPPTINSPVVTSNNIQVFPFNSPVQVTTSAGPFYQLEFGVPARPPPPFFGRVTGTKLTGRETIPVNGDYSANAAGQLIFSLNTGDSFVVESIAQQEQRGVGTWTSNGTPMGAFQIIFL